MTAKDEMTKNPKIELKTMELFAGGGGLALGGHLSGFKPAMLLEWERNSCETLRTNSKEWFGLRPQDIIEGDVRLFDPSPYVGGIDLLSGGPPCQPFSIGGKKNGFNDSRDLFPEYIRILKAVRPKTFIIENVKGLTSKRFADYLEFVHLRLKYLDQINDSNSSWEDQLKSLRKIKGSATNITYNITSSLLNAVDYGVPQSRERFFIIGIKSDLNTEFLFPEATHSWQALEYSKWVSGAYFKNHNIKPVGQASDSQKLIRQQKDLVFSKLPHVTVRDALGGLPEPKDGVSHKTIANHVGIPGARSYPGHTGSYIDLPAKTLKAGVHGCPGGENMILNVDGSVRYFSVREAARMQTFPDDYIFVGARGECMRQIGNAVPVKLATVLFSEISKTLFPTLSNYKKPLRRDLEVQMELDI